MRIKDYNPKDLANLILRFSDVTIKKTTAGQDYASFLGFDGETLIECKIWALTDADKEVLKSGEIYVTSGMMKDYQGKMQLNVSDIRIATDDDLKAEGLSRDDFYERAKLDVESLSESLNHYVNAIENKILKELVVEVLKEVGVEDYLYYPAALTMHHNYFSGLAYHVYSMLTLSDAYLDLYPFINRDLVYSGIILHDVGKLKELSGPKGTEYTKVGNLLGHISIGANIVYNKARELGYEESDEVISLIHIILSHHGLNEYGSPKQPQMAEAVLIYLLDFSDSRMAALEKEIPSVKEGEFSNQINAFDRKTFYKPKLSEDDDE